MYACMYACNIPAAEDSEEEENRSLSYELTKTLAATYMTIGYMSPKIVLLGTENHMELKISIYEQITSSCFLKCCRVFLTALLIFISRGRKTLEKTVSSHILLHKYYR